MLYNKNEYRKANDKKVLRKVGKQWKVMSVALLMAIGGAGVATHVNASASQRTPTVNFARPAKTHKTTKAHKARKAHKHKSESTVNVNQMEKEMNATEHGVYVNPKESSLGTVQLSKKDMNSLEKATPRKAKTKTKAKRAKKRPSINNTAVNLYNGLSRKQKADLKNGDSNLDAKLANKATKITGQPINGKSIKKSKSKKGTHSKKTRKHVKGADVLRNRIQKNVKQVNKGKRKNKAKVAKPFLPSAVANGTSTGISGSVSPEVASEVASLEANPTPTGQPQAPSFAPSNPTPAPMPASVASQSSVAPSSKVQQPSSVNASSAQSSATSQSVSASSQVQSSKASSTAQKSTVSSASAQPKPSTAVKSSAEVNYKKGDNGSAASYHAKAISAKNAYKKAMAKLHHYQSVKKQMSNPANSMEKQLASAKNDATSDQKLATSYANVAKKSGYSKMVSSIASNANVTTSYYTHSVGYSYNQNSDAVSNGAELTKELNVVNSLAQKVQSINTNSSASNSQKIKNASASDNAQSLLDKLNTAKHSLANMKSANASISTNNTNYQNASVANEIAKVNSLADANYVNSLSTSLNNSSNVQETIRSNAKNYDHNSTNFTQINFRNASNVATPVNATRGTSLNRVLSDVNAMNVFGNYKAENVMSTNDAREAVDSLGNAYNSASADASVQNALDSHPTLANVASKAGDYNKAMNLVQGKDANTVNSLATSANASLANAKTNSAKYAKRTKANVVLAPSLASSYSNKSKTDSTSASNAQKDLNDFYSQYLGYDMNNVSSEATNAKKALNHDNTFANAYGMHVYNVAPKYVTVTKGMSVNTKPRLWKRDQVGWVKPGNELKVTGVAFAKDGSTRYVVKPYRETHAKAGIVTANPKFVKNTYLFADKGNHVTVTVKKALRESTKAHYRKNTIVGVHKAGQKLSGRVVNIGGKYGGFTRIQLNNGHFITANTKYVRVNHARHMHKKEANGLPKGLVSF